MFQFIRSEISHFKNLPKKARTLLISFFLYSIAYPIISIFVNAFIWKNNSSIADIIYFRAGQFLIVPIGFMLGGVFLRYLNIKTLYFFGAILIAASSVLAIFINTSFLVIGILTGFGTGLYWSSRNYLSAKETDETNRNYFFGLLFSFATLIGLIITLLVGWLIVFGISYKLLIIVAFIFILLSGAFVLTMDFQTPKIGKIFMQNSSYIWIKKRFIHLGIGLVEGLSYVVPGLLILMILGNEGVLGTLTAISSIISTVLIYIYGRKSHSKDHKKYFIASTILGLIISIIMSVVFNKLTVIIFILLQGLVTSFMWLTLASPLLKNIDFEVGQIEDKRFSYILDTEFYLNSGRVMALFICLIIAQNFGVLNSLRFSPLILSTLQVGIFIFLERRI